MKNSAGRKTRVEYGLTDAVNFSFVRFSIRERVCAETGE